MTPEGRKKSDGLIIAVGRGIPQPITDELLFHCDYNPNDRDANALGKPTHPTPNAAVNPARNTTYPRYCNITIL
jgi:hypothetical protein